MNTMQSSALQSGISDAGAFCDNRALTLDRILSGCRRLEVPIILISAGVCEITEFALKNGALDCHVPAGARDLDPRLRNLIGTLLRLHQRRFRGMADGAESAWFGASLLELRESRDEERAFARKLDAEKRKLQNAAALSDRVRPERRFIVNILNKN